MVFGIQDTALTMRARGVSTLHGRGRGSRGREGEGGEEESTHSVHLRCILRKSRTCQAIRISFFIPRAPAPFSAPFPVDMQPFINTPPSPSLRPLARFSFALRLVGEAPPSTFLSTASTLSYLALSRNNVDSGLTSFADTGALGSCLGRKKEGGHAFHPSSL